MFDFEKLEVYKKSKNLNKETLDFLKKTHPIDSYIKNQLKRASVSMVINIAEGSGKFSKPDKRNFYAISRGSVYECVSLLDILHDDKIIPDNKFNYFYSKFEEISKMLMGLINSMK
jgi:four helix bundle protein